MNALQCSQPSGSEAAFISSDLMRVGRRNEMTSPSAVLRSNQTHDRRATGASEGPGVDICFPCTSFSTSDNTFHTLQPNRASSSSDLDDGTLAVFEHTGTTARIDFAGSEPFPTAQFVVVSPDDRHVYVAGGIRCRGFSPSTAGGRVPNAVRFGVSTAGERDTENLEQKLKQGGR